jgi:hypothetical protein
MGVRTLLTGILRRLDRPKFAATCLRVRARRTLSGNRRPALVRVLFLSDCKSTLNERQFSPFYFFRGSLGERLGFVFFPENAERFSPASARRYDLIVAKFHYQCPETAVLETLQSVQTHKRPDARLAYFDGNDDVCIQWPAVLDHVDLYVKRHVFRDRSQYLRTFVGGKNLTDYVHSRGVVCEGISQPVRKENLDKIWQGMTFGMDENILEMFAGGKGLVAPDRERGIDVFFRGNVPDNWMGLLRSSIAPALDGLPDGTRIICTAAGVPRAQYLEEIAAAKICISPFGYGEICYRDFESIISGCLLLKPDMGHVEAAPDIYRPFETYVPVAWDYSDLAEKVRWSLEHPGERLRIARAAQAVLKECCREEWFVDRVGGMLKRLGLS